MNFEVEDRESFGFWFEKTRERLKELAGIVGRKTRDEVLPGNNRSMENLQAHVDDLLEDLSDVSLEVSEHAIRAHEYYQLRLQKMTEDEIALGWSKAKKTVLDFCVKLDCQEKRVLDRLQAMQNTIERRVSVCQSMIKSLKP